MARYFTVVSEVRKGQGRAHRVRIASLGNSRVLCGIAAVPSCLAPGPGVIGAECESPIKRCLGVWALNWLVCI